MGLRRVLPAFAIATLASVAMPAAAQDVAETIAPEAPVPRHAPRTLGLTVGYVFTPINELPLANDGRDLHPMGLSIEGRYGWLVGGLDGSAASWVGFQTSFTALVGGAPRNAYAIDYGLFAKHALVRDRPARPFFAYGLGAAQTFVTGVDGRGVGHLTALSLGVDVRATQGMRATIELAYRFVIVPSFATELERARRYDYHALRLSAGVAFGR